MQLAGAEAAEGGGDLRRADPRGIEQPGPLDELDGRAAGGEHRPAARRLEARVAHALAGDGEREAHEIAAGGAAGGAVRRARDRPAAAARVGEVILEALVGHGVESRSGWRGGPAAAGRGPAGARHFVPELRR
jgi:hypothetical protein